MLPHIKFFIAGFSRHIHDTTLLYENFKRSKIFLKIKNFSDKTFFFFFLAFKYFLRFGRI